MVVLFYCVPVCQLIIIRLIWTVVSFREGNLNKKCIEKSDKMVIYISFREELVEEYAMMTAQAAARERRALWKVARYRLETRRLEFLTQDESKWQAELFDNPMVPMFEDDILDEAVKVTLFISFIDELSGS